MAFGYYGTIMIITRVFEDDSHADNGDPMFNFKSIVISSSAELLGLTVVILTVERVGRIRPQVICFFLGGVFSLILSISASSGSVILLTAISFCAKSVEGGASCLLWVTTAESLTTDIRATGKRVLSDVFGLITRRPNLLGNEYHLITNLFPTFSYDISSQDIAQPTPLLESVAFCAHSSYKKIFPTWLSG